MEIVRRARPDGSLGMAIVRSQGAPSSKALAAMAQPKFGLPDVVNDWRSDNWKHNVSKRGFPEVKIAERYGIPTVYGALMVTKVIDGRLVPYGLASLRVVTNNGVGAIVDAFQNLVELETFKYHGIGTGTTAEAAGDSALVTELTTQYNPDSTRATGTLTEAASNIFQTVATNNVDASVAITEHGVFTQAATGGGTLLDRSVFAAVNLASGDGLQTDYRLTFTAGG